MMNQPQAELPVPIPDSYWVRPGALLAGEYPRAHQDGPSRQKLRRFLQAGVNLFLDLTEPDEYGLKPYARLLRDEAAALGRSVERRNFPIPDMGVTTPEQMARILDTIDAALAEQQTVYVHCWGGIGRTGTVVGCYLVRHGLTGRAALAELERLRQAVPDRWQPSPQTPEQVRMVLRWPPRG